MKFKTKSYSAIVLVGGKGTRFSKKSDPPKHLTKLNKNLILINIINYIKNYGFKHFIFPLGSKKKYFVNFFNSKINQKKYKFELLQSTNSSRFKKDKTYISYFDAGENTKKLNRIYKSIKQSDTEDFLIVYGDDIANVNLDKLKKKYIQFNKKKVLVTVFKKNSQYGHLKINKNGKVIKFIEKPPHPLPINIGFYLINRNIFLKHFKSKMELETDFLPKIAKRNLLESYEHNGYFYSINDKKELLTARKKLKKL